MDGHLEPPFLDLSSLDLGISQPQDDSHPHPQSSFMLVTQIMAPRVKYMPSAQRQLLRPASSSPFSFDASFRPLSCTLQLCNSLGFSHLHIFHVLPFHIWVFSL